MIKLAYIRVSTKKQFLKKTHELQITKIKNYSNDEISKTYIDVASGKDQSRIELIKLKKYISSIPRTKKIVYITKIDRISRSIKDFYELISFFQENNCGLLAIDQSLDLTDNNIYSKMFIGFLGLMADFEGSFIWLRMKEGRERAIEEGKSLHRPLKKLNENEIKRQYLNGVSVRRIAKNFDSDWVTINSRLKKMGLKS